MFIKLVSFLFLVSSALMALEIDEKLTLRVLKTSSTKKTVLINRGIEDGLQIGDHAKFYLTQGMVARGVVVKTSPSRSVWSVYRVIDPAAIEKGKVMNLKISTPLKVTEDQTRMIIEEPNVSGRVVDIPLAEGAEEFDDKLSEMEEKELADIQRKEGGSSGEPLVYTSRYRQPKTWEIFSIFNYNRLSSSVASDANLSNSSGNSGQMSIYLGLEKYFNKPNIFIDNFSFKVFAGLQQSDATSSGGQTISNSAVEYGFGASWYFSNHPSTVGHTIWYADFNLGFGSTGDYQIIGGVENDYDGTMSFFSLGIGFKYYLSRVGFRVLLDYYRRVEEYTIVNNTYEVTHAGPRTTVGLQYRF